MDGWPPWMMVRNFRTGVAALWIDIAINMRPSCDLKRILSSLPSSAQKAILKLLVSETFDLGRPFFHHFRHIQPIF
jgi:hypothetical protein